MIILDPHIWIWWVEQNSRLTKNQQNLRENYCSEGLGVSIISCGEIAKLVEMIIINIVPKLLLILKT